MPYDLAQLAGFGNDVYISANVEIRRPHLVRVGNHIAIDTGFYLTTAATLGDHIHIAPYVTVIGGPDGVLKMDHFTNISAGSKIICGSDAFLGEGLITAPGIPDEYRDTLIVEPIVFERFANVGCNVVILPGVTLAEGTVIGASSLVTKSTEPWTIYYGTPARPVKARRKDQMLRYAEQLGYDR